ncbi:iron ABC transporter substrate-binding protein [Pseudonocardia sp.]|jgi:iron(III) transport system substrate-binding protein|uniref:iron ABC transporter substrate-binding protein n=1 Tax=Pseudonocardia sp. TaxID=60912 RepID=UPI002611D864|nr:iron ABC transporter substrate-binding protein [Pseudonocardia sp.]MCW2716840.1 extracellular solute-binding protein family 1 [Pseudonocardia sp.]
MWRRRGVQRNPLVLIVAAVALAASMAACGSSGPTLTLYNAQHADLAQAWIDGFTKETGIQVQVRQGGDFDMANQILAEGDASPADVFMTENSPALSLLSSKGALTPLDPATLAQVPTKYSSGSGDWVGIAARSTVVVYNPSLVSADQLPKSILDLSGPRWKDRIGIAAGGADFQAIASAVFAVNGDAAAEQWLAGLKQNARIYRNNVTILAAVDKGEVPAGVIYHYYWYKDRAESGADSKNAELEFFNQKDAGAFVSVSGAGVLKSSRHAAEAQRFVAYMSSRAGQQILADTDALEYPVGDGVPPNPKLKPFSELQPPDVDLNTLNGPKVIAEMQQVGLI